MNNLKVIYILSVTVLSGCAAGGASFVQPEPAPVNEGLIYVYRPPQFQGSALGVDVLADEKHFLTVDNGQFVAKTIAPGAHSFRSQSINIDKATPIDVEPGKTYYLRFGIQVGMWVSTLTLTEVTPRHAVNEMKECCKTGTDK